MEGSELRSRLASTSLAHASSREEGSLPHARTGFVAACPEQPRAVGGEHDTGCLRLLQREACAGAGFVVRRRAPERLLDATPVQSKYVASRGTPELSWDTSTRIADAGAEVRDLRERHEQIHTWGSVLDLTLYLA
jgi:hypothetical protein